MEDTLYPDIGMEPTQAGEEREQIVCEDCGHPRSEHHNLYCETCVRDSSDRGQWNGSPCA